MFSFLLKPWASSDAADAESPACFPTFIHFRFVRNFTLTTSGRTPLVCSHSTAEQLLCKFSGCPGLARGMLLGSGNISACRTQDWGTTDMDMAHPEPDVKLLLVKDSYMGYERDPTHPLWNILPTFHKPSDPISETLRSLRPIGHKSQEVYVIQSRGFRF